MIPYKLSRKRECLSVINKVVLMSTSVGIHVEALGQSWNEDGKIRMSILWLGQAPFPLEANLGGVALSTQPCLESHA